MMTLSIGIPTYQRPDLLKRSIKSITDQKNIDHFQIEILIGDDSKKSNYSELIELIEICPKNIVLKYQHNQPSKGQNENVADIINRAEGTFFCLMHDDDYFLEDAVELLLIKAIENNDCIVFGKQLIMTDQYDYKHSESVNYYFKRTQAFAGKQEDSVKMAMLQQCPNDGYILKTEIAKRIGIRAKNIVGTACDFDFALRAAIVTKTDFFFIDHYTTVYAVISDSVTNSFANNAGERKLEILQEYRTDVTHPEIFRQVMKADLSMVISFYISTNNLVQARKKYFNFKNFLNYLWYKPTTYLQFFKLIS